MTIEIIYKDSDLVVICKPSGLTSDRSETTKVVTLQDWIENNFHLLGNDEQFRKRSGLVHRLDKDTSGLIIIALNENSFFSLQKQFKQRVVKKKYLCLVHGLLENVGSVNAPILRNPSNKAKFSVLSSGKTAITQYKPLNHFNIPEQFLSKDFRKQKDKKLHTATLVEVCPETGRTHQIRVHMNYIGHPIVADTIYGGRKTLRSDAIWCSRLFLHAKEISFKHPVIKKILHFDSSLPDDLSEVLKKLVLRT